MKNHYLYIHPTIDGYLGFLPVFNYYEACYYEESIHVL